jgi:hypothetical protein
MRPGLKLGAVVCGVLVAVTTQVLLTSLGAAIGLTAFSVTDQTRTELHVTYVAFLVATLCVSVFFGAYVAAAGARSPLRADGALHGVVTWAAIGLVGFFLVGRNVEDILGTGLSVAGETAVAAAAPEVKQRVSGTVDQVKEAVAEVGEGIQTMQAVDDARQVVAIGLWGFVGVQGVLLLAALAGGVVGGRRSRRRLAAYAAAGLVPPAVTPPVVR